jgi:membrane fusion protein, multidrug efflux system
MPQARRQLMQMTSVTRSRAAPLLITRAAAGPLAHVLCLASILAAALTGCSPADTNQPRVQAPPEVRTVMAWTGPVEVAAHSVGQIRAVDSVTLAAEVAGLVRAVHFTEGTAVEAGDLLVELDDTRARAELQSAQAARDRAARQQERYQQAATVASQTELDTVRTELTQAEAQLDLARIRVENHRIIAPFNGRVGLRLVSPGAYIQPGTALTTLTTVDPVDLEFAVPEVYLANLRPGLSLSARTVAYDREFPAQVRAITPEIDPSTRTALVLARAPNPEGLLRPGMSLTVRVILSRRSDAVLVPEPALLFQGSQVSVYIVEGDEVRSRRVRIGERQSAIVEVLEGVQSGEQIVVAGLQRIRDGSRVRAVPEQPPQPPRAITTPPSSADQSEGSG